MICSSDGREKTVGTVTRRKGVRQMRIVLVLLLLCVGALAETPSDDGQKKPAAIQDGSAAQSFIRTALYEYLDNPPFLAIEAETPFFVKRIDGESRWVALVEFYCGVSEENKALCLTVIIYNPATNEHRFMTPEDVVKASGEGDSI
jgi:hypothetical protein